MGELGQAQLSERLTRGRLRRRVEIGGVGPELRDERAQQIADREEFVGLHG